MNPQNTTEAIATLQAFTSTQRPLLNVIDFAIEVLQGNYNEKLASGDLKIATERAETAEAQNVGKDATIIALTAENQALKVAPVEEIIK